MGKNKSFNYKMNKQYNDGYDTGYQMGSINSEKVNYEKGVDDGRKSAMPVVYLLGLAILIIILQSAGII